MKWKVFIPVLKMGCQHRREKLTVIVSNPSIILFFGLELKEKKQKLKLRVAIWVIKNFP